MSTRSSRSSWIWLLVLFSVAGAVESAFFGQIASFTPLYLPQLGISSEQVDDWTAGIMAAANVVGILFLPFWGALSDRYSRKPVIVRSFVAHLVAIGFMLVTGNIWMFVIGRTVMNLSLGNSGLMMTTLVERAPAERLGLSFAILNGTSTVGVFLGPLFGGPILDRWSFEVLLLINGVLLLSLIGALIFGYRDNFKGTDNEPVMRMALDSLRILIGSRQLRFLFLSFLVLFCGWMLTRTYISLVVMSLYKGPMPGSAIGNVAAAAGAAALILGPLGGALSDRWGHGRVLFVGAVLQVLLWPLPALAWDIASFTIAWVVLNAVVSAVFAVSFAVLSSAAPEKIRGRVMSFAYLPINLALIAGPLLAAPVVNHFGVMAVFPLSAVLTLMSVGLLARTRVQF